MISIFFLITRFFFFVLSQSTTSLTVVETYIGNKVVCYSTDGTRATAEFTSPIALVFSSSNQYLFTIDNGILRATSISTGATTTYCGSAPSCSATPMKFMNPSGIAIRSTSSDPPTLLVLDSEGLWVVPPTGSRNLWSGDVAKKLIGVAVDVESNTSSITMVTSEFVYVWYPPGGFETTWPSAVVPKVLAGFGKITSNVTTVAKPCLNITTTALFDEPFLGVTSYDPSIIVISATNVWLIQRGTDGNCMNVMKVSGKGSGILLSGESFVSLTFGDGLSNAFIGTTHGVLEVIFNQQNNSGTLRRLCGFGSPPVKPQSIQDGSGAVAKFSSPKGITVDKKRRTIFLIDSCTIRNVTLLTPPPVTPSPPPQTFSLAPASPPVDTTESPLTSSPPPTTTPPPETQEVTPPPPNTPSPTSTTTKSPSPSATPTSNNNVTSNRSSVSELDTPYTAVMAVGVLCAVVGVSQSTSAYVASLGHLSLCEDSNQYTPFWSEHPTQVIIFDSPHVAAVIINGGTVFSFWILTYLLSQSRTFYIIVARTAIALHSFFLISIAQESLLAIQENDGGAGIGCTVLLGYVAVSMWISYYVITRSLSETTWVTNDEYDLNDISIVSLFMHENITYTSTKADSMFLIAWGHLFDTYEFGAQRLIVIEFLLLIIVGALFGLSPMLTCDVTCVAVFASMCVLNFLHAVVHPEHTRLDSVLSGANKVMSLALVPLSSHVLGREPFTHLRDAMLWGLLVILLLQCARRLCKRGYPSAARVTTPIGVETDHVPSVIRNSGGSSTNDMEMALLRVMQKYDPSAFHHHQQQEAKTYVYPYAIPTSPTTFASPHNRVIY